MASAALEVARFFMRHVPRYTVLSQALRELAAERDLELSACAGELLLRLESRDRTEWVFRGHFGLNRAVNEAIANDKAATSEILRVHGVPCIEHRVFERLDEHATGDWDELEAFARSHRYQLVCKPNTGGGGRGVQRVGNRLELHQSVRVLRQQRSSVAVCPYQQLDAEFRCVMLQGRCELSYSKERPTVVGDGRATVAELLVEQIRRLTVSPRLARAVAAEPALRDYVPPSGQAVPITWKHNLSEGATPREIKEPALNGALRVLAQRAVEALGMTFAAVDIVICAGRLSVLEVNTAILMETYGTLSDANYGRAKRLYGKALDALHAVPREGGVPAGTSAPRDAVTRQSAASLAP